MFLNAYYFRQHMYTLVPRHVREDMEWMVSVGTDAVSIGVLEQDLFAAEANMDIICREAERVGMEVYAVPSRWGGLVAGAPKVPSLFGSTRPETWMLEEDGSPHTSFGPCCSVHHPATYDFFCETLERLLLRWPITGVIWDEPKALTKADHSPMARKAKPHDAPLEWHTDSFTGFFDRVNLHARSVRPDVRLAMFIYGHLDGHPLESCARIPSLDDFGLDGRPWSLAQDAPPDPRDEAHKSLIDQAPRFIEAARRHGKRPMMLIEHHNMVEECFDLMDRRLSDVLSLDADHILYYYYGRNVPNPDRQMEIIARHLRTKKYGTGETDA